MFDMSWGEVMVIGTVALIVIGPKDLPKALRTVGRMTTKMRRMAHEFNSQVHEAMREAELDDVRNEIQGINHSVKSATSPGFNPIQTIRDELKGAVERPAAQTSGSHQSGSLDVSAGTAGASGAGASALPAEELPVPLPPPVPAAVLEPTPPAAPEPVALPEPVAVPAAVPAPHPSPEPGAVRPDGSRA